MLKTRIISAIVVKGGIVVQSIGFKKYLPVGSPAITAAFLNQWGIDEIILMDIDATPESRSPDFEKIAWYSKCCQVPLTVGGGIKTISDIEKALYSGADKVSINTSAVKNPSFIKKAAHIFGKQCIVVSMDVFRYDNGTYRLFINSGKAPTDYNPRDFARKAEDLGAGEILINAIHRDGSKKGYDIDLICLVKESVDVPVIALGGVGNPEHLLEGIKLNVSGVAAANFFHFTEHSVIVAKSYLKFKGMPKRLDTYADYAGFFYDDINGRVMKKDDYALEDLRFIYIPEEKI